MRITAMLAAVLLAACGSEMAAQDAGPGRCAQWAAINADERTHAGAYQPCTDLHFCAGDALATCAPSPLSPAQACSFRVGFCTAQCAADRDCAGGVCEAGYCHQTCDAARPCGALFDCVGGDAGRSVCVPAAP